MTMHLDIKASEALIYPFRILCEGAMSAVRIAAATLLTACPGLWFILYTELLLFTSLW